MSKMMFCIQNFLSHVRITAVIEYDGQLSATAYIILAVVLLGITGGLLWCFYRAVKTTDTSAEVQKPDEIGD